MITELVIASSEADGNGEDGNAIILEVNSGTPLKGRVCDEDVADKITDDIFAINTRDCDNCVLAVCPE